MVGEIIERRADDYGVHAHIYLVLSDRPIWKAGSRIETAGSDLPGLRRNGRHRLQGRRWNHGFDQRQQVDGSDVSRYGLPSDDPTGTITESAMVTLSILGQMDLLAMTHAPAAAGEVVNPFVFRLSIFVLAV